MILANETFLLVNCLGHSASFLRDSAVSRDPPKDVKQNRLFMGFPGEKQVRYGPNEPGNQAPGRSASMVTRTVSHGRHSAKF
jgi:hypothetical protein